MILTEQEAKTKVCPHMSKRDAFTRERKCIASDCMGWRWAERKAPEELEARKTWNQNPGEPKGYCGA